ncbi:MAG TPA: hypothetical protein VMS99_18325 [Acidimicrobiia bacterium]|nr:hypothetical protein [Acidimicrobiia bacterium]
MASHRWSLDDPGAYAAAIRTTLVSRNGRPTTHQRAIRDRSTDGPSLMASRYKP